MNMNAQEIESIKRFWAEEQNVENLIKMTQLESLNDPDLEAETRDILIKTIASKTNIANFGNFQSRAELAEKALILSGFNKNAYAPKPDILVTPDDPEKTQKEIKALLSAAMGSDGDTALFSEPISHSLLMHWYKPDSTGFSEEAKKAIDDYLTDDIKSTLLTRIKEGSITPPFSDPEAQAFFTEQGVRLANVKQNTSVPLMGTDALDSELGKLEAKAEADFNKFRLFQDAKISAQMEINRILEEQNDLVFRTVVDKLRDKVVFGAKDILNQRSALQYPNESVFSNSLARMDSNGRVVDTLLRFKENSKGPVVCFDRHNVPNEIYDIAANKCREGGIMKPHISTTFKDPQVAIFFMQSTVDALLKAGYEIDDISVDRQIEVAFENYKKKLAAQTFTISERPEIDEQKNANDTSPEKELTAAQNQELVNQTNAAVNSPTEALRNIKMDQEKGLTIKDLGFSELRAILELVPLLEEDPLTWDEMQQQVGLSPIARTSVVEARDFILKIVDKFDHEGEKFDFNRIGINQAKLIRDLGLHILIPISGQDKARRAFDVATDKIRTEIPTEQKQENDQSTPTVNEKKSASTHTENTQEQPNENRASHAMSNDEPIDINEIPVPPMDMDEAEMSRAASMDFEAANAVPFDVDYGYHQDNGQVDINVNNGVMTSETDHVENKTASIDPPTQEKQAGTIHPLLSLSTVKTFNSGGTFVDEQHVHEWKSLAQDIFRCSEKGHSLETYSALSTPQLHVLIAMSHHEQATLQTLPGLSRRESVAIINVSQNLHGILANNHKQVSYNTAPLTALEMRLAKELNTDLLPEHIKNPGVTTPPPIKENRPSGNNPKPR